MSRLTSIPKDFFHWLREATTPANLLDSLKTAIWVVPLTIMIWAYAEQEQSTEVRGQPILIDVNSQDPNRIVTVIDRGGDIPLADLTGSKSSLDQVVAKLGEGDKRWVHITIPSEIQPGLHEWNIAEEIARSDIFRNDGITVSNVHPQRIQVKIDELRTLPEVTVTAAANPNLVDTPLVTPRTVKIVAPASLISSIPKETSLAFVTIPTTGENSIPGEHHGVSLSVSSPLTGDNVTITPALVSVTYTIKQSNERYKVPSVPLLRLLSPGVPTDVVVDGLPSTLSNVWVTGPHDQIAKIQSNEVSPYAMVLINSDDTDGHPKTKTLNYVTGEPDVKVEDQSLPVTFSAHRANGTP